MTNIAFLGLGAMGSRMAANLLKFDFTVSVWNRSPGPDETLKLLGAAVATTPRAAADGADIVVSMVRDDEASKEIWLDDTTGALGSMKAGAIAMESSTITVDWARELAATVAASGQRFLEAPVAGSRPQAEAGILIYICGGDADTFTEAMPAMQAMGGTQHHVGDAGSGALVKLAVNTLLGIQQAALAEILGMAKRGGIDPAAMANVIIGTPTCSPLAKMAAESMVAKNFAPLFPVNLMEKDLGYVLAAAGGEGMPLAQATHDVFTKAMDVGYGDDNMSGVIQLYIPDGGA